MWRDMVGDVMAHLSPNISCINNYNDHVEIIMLFITDFIYSPIMFASKIDNKWNEVDGKF